MSAPQSGGSTDGPTATMQPKPEAPPRFGSLRLPSSYSRRHRARENRVYLHMSAICILFASALLNRAACVGSWPDTPAS